MKDSIFDVAFWKDRLDKADQLHHAIFRCPLEKWQRIEVKHKEILDKTLNKGDWVLDAGCGWGRLLNLLPKDRIDGYVGIDISPDFISLARHWHPAYEFIQCDMRDLSCLGMKKFHWGVLISIKPMVIRNFGEGVWEQIEKQLKHHCQYLLCLEYDENDDGEILQ